MTSTTVTLPTPTTILIERLFDAPIGIVFAAHTEPEHLTKWMTGPDGFALVSATADVRTGGNYVWHYEAPGGGSMDLHGDYVEVDAPHRMLVKEDWGPEMPGPTVETVFSQVDGRTLVSMTMTLPSQEFRDHVIEQGGMRTGYEISHDQLDTLLARMS